jgi:ABC-type branched-subunit amino acid transport system ATPase component
VIFASSSAFENVFKTLPVLDNLSLGAVREEAERMERKKL